MKVVVIDEASKQPYDLTGRFCDILLWLLARREFIAGADRGNLQIDFAGESLMMSFKDISDTNPSKN